MHSTMSMNKTMIGAVLLLGCLTARAEGLAFTVPHANSGSLPSGNAIGALAGANVCASKGWCSSAITFNTVAGGKLTVTAGDGGAGDPGALAVQLDRVNAGLGVVAGSKKTDGSFQISDLNYALDDRKETLTLSFENAVQLNSLFFFPDNIPLIISSTQLDKLDGFTLSVDGGAAVEYSFGTQNGLPVSFSTPLVGRTFTLGYANKLSVENYYLGGMTFAAAVPENGTLAMMALGLAGTMVAVRRRHQDRS